jgi:diguanylate cyclase (GGDEF)-like protein
LVVIGLIFAVALAGAAVPLLKYLDNELVARRFAAAPRPASGEIVYLAIDKKTLDTVGTWPWPRSIYANLLEKLSGVGVNDIFIDIDFSTPSSQTEDTALAEGLAKAGGGVILPVFGQRLSAGDPGLLAVTRPIPMLGANAWLAFADVVADDDSVVRSIRGGDILDGQKTQSVAAVLGRSDDADGSLLIDYSIDPNTVPMISLAEVFDPAFDDNRLAGRSVVVGAYASELKDIFPVPVYRQLPGPLLHILGAESLKQDRLLRPVPRLPLDLGLAALVISVVLSLRARPTLIVAGLAAATAIAIEGLAFFLQKNDGILLSTATCWAVLLLGILLALTEKVNFSQFLIEIANAEQRNIRRLLRKVVADSTDAVIAFDHNMNIFEVSASAGPMLAAGTSSRRGASLEDVLPNSLYRQVLSLVSEHVREPLAVHGCTRQVSMEVDGSLRHLDATVTLSPLERPDESGRSVTASFIGSLMIRDMTARRHYEERLRYLSQYDDLTGLMNRRTFSTHIKQYEGQFFVLAIGLHRLSVINATMGRDTGDDVLRGVAALLTAEPRITAVARLGGDVFAIVIPKRGVERQEEMIKIVMDLFAAPLEVGLSSNQLSVRVGICADMLPDEAGDVWVERAEHALDDAARVAGSGWRAYDPAAALQQQHARELERAMRDSLTRGEFFLAYQPQVDLATGRLRGAEALLRWNHPTFGFVSPATFIPVAEANGFVCELGRWAINEACREAALWPDELSVAVNVAPVQLIRSDLVADVRLALQRHGIPSRRLQLEITESAFVERSSQVFGTIEALREMGIEIALDDFGTGYSNLAHLAEFPLDKLKIDQSFVRKLADDPSSLAIVQTIKSLAEGLRLRVVAEGVETQVEAQLLAAMGCELGQGYYFGKPQTSEDLLRLLDAAPWVTAA